MLRLWLTMNFLVCVLCLQALAAAACAELSQHPVFVGAAGVTQVPSRQLVTGKREDIKGVCHTQAVWVCGGVLDFLRKVGGACACSVLTCTPITDIQ